MLTHCSINNLLYLCSKQKERVNIEIMKYLKFLRLMPMALVLTVMITACSTQDVYEPKPDPDPVDPEEPTVPAVDIDWQTYTTTVLNVEVDDVYNGAFYYTVEVYVDSPIGDNSAKMIAGSGQKTNSKVGYSRELVLPNGVEYIYVAITDPFKRRLVYGMDVEEGTMNLALGRNSVNTKSEMSGLRSDTVVEMPVIDFQVPADAKTLSGTGAGTLGKTDTYVIPKGATYTGIIDFTEDQITTTQLFVEGTLVLTGNLNMERLTRIYVCEGGKVITSSSIEIVMKHDAVVAIAEGGQFGSTTGKFTFSKINGTSSKIVNEGVAVIEYVETVNTTGVYNSGDLTLHNAKIDSQSELVNYGTIVGGTKVEVVSGGHIHNENVIVFDKVITSGSTSTIYNNHKFEIGELNHTASYIYNNCYLRVDEFTVTTGYVSLSPTGYVNAKVLKPSGLFLNMDEGSMWESETAVFEGKGTRVKGVGGDYALFKITDVLSYAGNSATGTNPILGFDGKVQVQFDSFNKVFWKLENGAANADGQASVEIESTECNGGSGNNNPGEGDGDDDDKYEEDETLPYTYMFEDNWPVAGDYDMNDVVIAVELRNTTSGTKTQSTQVIATLYAVGATKVLGAGFQLDGIRASSVSGGEAGQDYAVFRLFNDAHATLGGPSGIQLNTYRIEYEPKVIETEVVYSTPIDGMINASNFNLFLVLGGNFDQDKRNEVHLPGFKGTNKASIHENSTADYIDVATGWMWGLAIPQTEFATYPKENVKIYDAYQGFDTWVAGSDTPDWYYYPVDGSVIIFE